MPKTVRITPPKKNIETIRLGHPKTEYPHFNELVKIQADPIIEIDEIANPKYTANFRGLSEKDNIISDANCILFFKV